MAFLETSRTGLLNEQKGLRKEGLDDPADQRELEGMEKERKEDQPAKEKGTPRRWWVTRNASYE
jgi:hypothetical protein